MLKLIYLNKNIHILTQKKEKEGLESECSHKVVMHQANAHTHIHK